MSPAVLKSRQSIIDTEGMAGYLADRSLGSRGVGGLATKKNQAFVEFVIDPATNLDIGT